ncbi:MAG: 5'/3'-nucleotidase SurE [Candidatus Marinimicrobia bacterium]|nr:5'/3'-nucleotidase SurE [Candidatus Neomarinimicrobiota bacterium]|tara:strand:+ start:2071 stop:2832 length:762 start_codon:yes stop_codon:yes gene_type:complete
MKILITNDDGIFYPGIYALHEAAESFGDITIVAPSVERSATSHSISLNNSLSLRKIKINGIRAYSCTGTPVDCVKLAIHELFDDNKPDLILSGINKGSNTSQNILYSGTVSAAVEGLFNGIPSFAISVNSLNPDEFKTATKITKFILKKFLDLKLISNTVMNINIPQVKYEDIKGIRITRQGKTKFQDSFYKSKEGLNLFNLDGELKIFRDKDQNDDYCIEENFVSLTPLQFDLTHYKEYIKLKKIENKFNKF